MINFIRIFGVFMLLSLPVPALMAAEDPLAMLIDAKGDVFYSPDGSAWKNVNRNKFLFKGWRVKTGRDGVCKVLKHDSDMIEVLAAETEIEIGTDNTKVLQGNISDTRPARSFSGFLKRRFATVQKYTTTRRSVKPDKDISLKTVKEITLSTDYPELVWENMGQEYSYQLYVGEDVFEIPGNEDKLVRFRLPLTVAGKNDYCVNVLYKGEVLYAPPERNTLKWLSEEEKQNFHKEMAHIFEIAPDNNFLLATFLEEQGFTVVAMDRYREFLAENPDAHEVRPFLIRVLGELELEKLKKEEMALYQVQQK